MKLILTFCRFLLWATAVSSVVACSADATVPLARTEKADISYQISVVDESGRPVPYATLWVSVSSGTAPQVTVASLRRAIERFGDDGDFSTSGEAAAPEILVYRANQDGRIKNLYDNASSGENLDLLVNVAAQKRGFHPAISSSRVNAGERVDLVLRLKRDVDAKPQMALLELDRLRSEISEVRIEDLQQDDVEQILDRREAIRLIAESLVASHDNDAASRVYFGLATLPSIEIERDATGKIVSEGYTSGFDPTSALRQADMERALELNVGAPYLKYAAAKRKFDQEGIFVFVDKTKDAERRRFIEITEAALSSNPPGAWPDAYVRLWQTYAAIGDYRSACRSLKAFKSFEPEFFSSESWDQIMVELNREDRGEPGKKVSCSYDSSR